MGIDDRSADSAAGVPSEALARTPAESHGFLVRRLTQESARDLAARAFDDALGVVGAENTVTADEIGADPKVVLSMRRGVKALGVYRLLQVNAKTFEETFRQLRTVRERVYGAEPTTDAHDIVAATVQRCASFAASELPGHFKVFKDYLLEFEWSRKLLRHLHDGYIGSFRPHWQLQRSF
jgi:hypothetical protein